MDCFACGGDVCCFKVTLSVSRNVNTLFGQRDRHLGWGAALAGRAMCSYSSDKGISKFEAFMFSNTHDLLILGINDDQGTVFGGCC